MLLSISVIAAVLLFIGLSVNKAYQYAKMPLHGRMELYPVPSEKGRHKYGGSYMEEPEWWSKPRQVSKASELVDMMKEMLFIKKLFDNQKSLWWISYAFHLGIYFLMAWIILLIAGALTDLAGAAVSDHASLWTAFLYYLTVFTGITGWAITTAGAALLLIRRVFDAVLKKYTTPLEYFNLLLLLAALTSGIAVWGTDLTFDHARQVTAGIMTLSAAADTALVIHLILLDVTLVYIPLSKMSHYVGKYFSFHKVLWENEPNISGSQIEKKLKNAPVNQVSAAWSAPHMQVPPAAGTES
ncbi:MAG TPA: respiratory nitrate reductase subunit gamma [Syntrophomonadaceae bacterium]|nr:respiratory nitrate reductase subunit gamma [Syntrophomonadaceae bacterium]HPR94193.1 respiratory nitrate reductase subunit gamma [Syntrophomonadaceae bacterium]